MNTPHDKPTLSEMLVWLESQWQHANAEGNAHVVDAIRGLLRSRDEAGLNHALKLLLGHCERTVRYGPKNTPVAAYDQDLLDAIAVVRSSALPAPPVVEPKCATCGGPLILRNDSYYT